jgi:hypothetical protein
MSKKEYSDKKCIAVHLTVDLLEHIQKFKVESGRSQNGIITDLIEKGLDIRKKNREQNAIFYFVKVRIDTNLMMEFGQKLQSGELDTSHTIMTFCDINDPTVGMSFWQAESQKEFDEIFSQHKRYYKEIIEILPVITPLEAMNLILKY